MAHPRALRRGIRASALALAACLMTASPAIAQPTDAKTLATANGLLGRGLYHLAAPKYEAYLEGSPAPTNAATAQYGLAVCYVRLGKPEDALASLSRIGDRDDFEFKDEASLLKGHCLLQLGRLDLAADTFNVMANSASETLRDDAAGLLAEVQYRQKRYDECLRTVDALTRRWPNSEQRDRAELFGAMAAIERKDLKNAQSRLEALIQRQQSLPKPQQAYLDRSRLLLAQCHRTLGKPQLATRLYREVLESGNASLTQEALLGIAGTAHTAGDRREATAALDSLARLKPDGDVRARAQLLQARIWLDDEEYARAAASLDDLLDDQKSASLHDDAAYWRAKVDLRRGDDDEAAERLERAMRRHPKSDLLPEMLYDRGVALSRERRPDEAIECFNTFLESHETHALKPQVIRNIASIEHKRGDYEAARAACETLQRQNPDQPLPDDVALLWAESSFLLGDNDDAARRYEAIMEHGSEEARTKATLRLGQIRAREGRFDDAETLLASAASGPEGATRVPALLELGDSLFQREQWGEAEQTFATLADVRPHVRQRDDVLLKLGIARLRLGNEDGALEALDELLDDYDDSVHRVQAEFERGQAYLERGDDRRAARAFENVLDQGESTRFAPYAMSHLGAIAQREGDLAAAEDWYAKAANAEWSDGQGRSGDALLRRGIVLIEQGELEEGVQTLESFLITHADHPSSGEAAARLGMAHARLGNHDAAIRSLSEARVEGPLRSRVEYERAWVLRDMGSDDEALAAYDRFLHSDPDTSLRAHALLDAAGIEIKQQEYAQASARLAEVLDLARDEGVGEGQSRVAPRVYEQARYQAGACALRLERYDDVAQTLKTFSRDFPESSLRASADLLCAEGLMQTGRHRQAIEYLDRAASDRTSNDVRPSALLRLGEANAAQRNWAESERAFRTYLAENSTSPVWFQAQFGIGQARENQSRFREAIDAYQEVVDRHEGETAARAQFQIGECLYAMKKYADAATALLSVDILYAYPQWSAAALYEAGRCFEELGSAEEAREQFQTVIDRFSETRWAELAGNRLSQLSDARTTSQTRPRAGAGRTTPNGGSN